MSNLDPLVQQTRLDSAQKEVNVAAQEFNEEQRNFKKSVSSIHEQMALYSSGIISLSITFLGYLLSSSGAADILRSTRIIVPIYWILYLRWLLLASNILHMEAEKWFYSLYLFFNSQNNYHQKRKDLQEALIPYYQTYPNIVFEEGSDRGTAIDIAKQNVEILNNKLIPKTSRMADRYYKWFGKLQKVSITSFALAIVLLLVFSVATTRLIILKAT